MRRTIGPATAELELSLGETLSLERALVEAGPQGRVELSGSLDQALDVRRWIEGIDWRDLGLALHARADVPDARWINQWFDDLDITGAWTAEVDARGLAGAPTLSARVDVEEGRLRFGSAFPAIEPVHVDVRLDQGALRATLDGELGASPFELVAEVSMGSAPAEFDVRLSGDNLLLKRGNGVKLRADTDLRLRGPLDDLRSDGRITLTDGRFVRRLPLVEGFLQRRASTTVERGLDFGFARSGPLADMQLDIEVRSSEPFQLANNVINGAVRPELRIRGTGRVPLPAGAVYFEPTRVALPSGRLIVRSGTLTFLEENPFVPTLDLTAEASIKGYAIDATVTGDYDEPTISLSSRPPLSDDDLLVLLFTGSTPEGASASRAGQTVAVYLAEDFLSRWLSSESTETSETLLDRLDIQAGRDVTRSGADTVEVAYRVSQDPRGTGRVQYVTGELDEYDRINFGYRIVFRFR